MIRNIFGRNRIDSASEISSGKSKPLATSLLQHGFFWVSFSILFDYLTSWIMMLLKGPNSEGNSIARAFFEQRNITTFLMLVTSRWSWILFVTIGGVAYFVSSSRRMSHFASSKSFELHLTSIFTWIPAFYRLALGSSTNLAAIFDPSINFVTFLEIVFAALISLGFLLTCRKFFAKKGSLKRSDVTSQVTSKYQLLWQCLPCCVHIPCHRSTYR